MPKKSGYPENAIAPPKGNPKYLKSGDGLEFAGAKKLNSEAPQCPEDQRGPGYDNKTSEKWLTGAVQATEMPNFDHSEPRSKMRR